MAKKERPPARKPRAKQVPVQDFLPKYLAALDRGTFLEDFSRSIGMTPQAVRQRVYVMRLRGHAVDYLPTWNSRHGCRSNDRAIIRILREHTEKKEQH